MRKYNFVVFIISIFFLAAFLSAGLVPQANGQERRNDAPKNFSDEKERYKSDAREKLNDLDKGIKELDMKIKRAGSRAKADIRREMEELKRKLMELKRDMGRLNAKSEIEWEKVKHRTDAAMDDLDREYHKVRSHFELE